MHGRRREVHPLHPELGRRPPLHELAHVRRGDFPGRLVARLCVIFHFYHPVAHWLSARLRRRIIDFTTVLGCRFPTIMDIRSSAWGKSALRALASWRYRFQRYDNPWELRASRRIIRQWDPRIMSL